MVARNLRIPTHIFGGSQTEPAAILRRNIYLPSEECEFPFPKKNLQPTQIPQPGKAFSDRMYRRLYI